MECTGVDSFGCLMSGMGSTVGGFLNSFGTPASTLIFILFMIAVVVIMGVAFGKVLSR